MQTYYIDLEQRTGDGLTPRQPRGDYRDLPLQPGDQVLFRRGSRSHDFLETQSGDSQAPILYGAYGEGPQPVFCGSIDVSSPEDWKQVSAHIWECVHEIPLEACNMIFNDGEHCGNIRWGEDELVVQGDWTDSRMGASEVDPPKVMPPQRLLLYSEICPAQYYRKIACATREFRQLGILKSNVIIQDICFCNNGVHGLAGAGENIVVRRCSFIRLGGCVWHRRRKIRFGNAVEFWCISRNVSVIENYFYDIYDSGVTHQGDERCEITVNAHFDRNVFIRCGMGAYEGRDLVPNNLTFCGNVCLDAGCGFSRNGVTMPRNSEIWPQPMGHHLFLWRMDRAAEGGYVKISGNFFGSAPYGGAVYSIMSAEAEAQFEVNNNIYAMPQMTLLNRWGGVDYQSLAQFQQATGQEGQGADIRPAGRRQLYRQL